MGFDAAAITGLILVMRETHFYLRLSYYRRHYKVSARQEGRTHS